MRQIDLDVVMDRGSIEDLLRLGVRTDPPIMKGPIRLKTKLKISPGKHDIADRLWLAGSFHVPGGYFTNEKVQTRVDSLSLRGLGKPKLISKEGGRVLSFSLLHFQIPGLTRT